VNFVAPGARIGCRRRRALRTMRGQMRFGVTSKLFLVFLATNVAIALAVAVAAQIAVKTGFRNYVNEREERRLSTLSDALTDAYREHGNWDFLRGNDALWRALRTRRFGWDDRARERMKRRRKQSGSADRLQRATPTEKNVAPLQNGEGLRLAGIGVLEGRQRLQIFHADVLPSFRRSDESVGSEPPRNCGRNVKSHEVDGLVPVKLPLTRLV
jgi:hypothetical protein